MDNTIRLHKNSGIFLCVLLILLATFCIAGPVGAYSGGRDTDLSLYINNTNPLPNQTITFTGFLKTEKHAPLSGMNITLEVSPDCHNWTLFNATPAITDANGKYNFSGMLDAGKYCFRVHFNGTDQYRGEYSDSEQVKVERGDTDLSLYINDTNPLPNQTITFTGFLKTEKHAPLSGMNITLEVSPDCHNWTLFNATPAITDANGKYNFSGMLDAGKYCFRAHFNGTDQYRGEYSDSEQVKVERGDTDLSLYINNTKPLPNQTITFTGFLKTEKHAPLSGMNITLEVSPDCHNWTLFNTTPAITDANGKYNFSGMFTAGKYCFRAHFNGTDQYRGEYSDSEQVKVERGDTDLSLYINNTKPLPNQTITFTGFLKTEKHAPLSGMNITLEVSPDCHNWTLFNATPAITDANGKYNFSGMFDAGKYCFRAHFNGTDLYRGEYSDSIQIIFAVKQKH